VRFSWGTFRFDGMMDSLDENLEFWSSDGKPLRSNLTIGLSQQKISNAFNPARAGAAAAPGVPAAPGGGTPGTRPLTPAPAGATVQGLAGAAGAGANWQAIASANGIENPRALAPGQLLDLSARAQVGGSAGFGGTLGIGGG
jgi:hypothetical protein